MNLLFNQTSLSDETQFCALAALAKVTFVILERPPVLLVRLQVWTVELVQHICCISTQLIKHFQLSENSSVFEFPEIYSRQLKWIFNLKKDFYEVQIYFYVTGFLVGFLLIFHYFH